MPDRASMLEVVSGIILALIQQAVERWLFENDTFAEKMETFARERCEIFDLESSEQKLEYAVHYYYYYYYY